jgi:8-oxo-dGTP pyrophosphatase MutT (NUDIX family)
VEEVSAGGLVVDLEGTVSGVSEPSAVLIGKRSRRGHLLWALPKGHLEAGENDEQAAVREVREETGIDARIQARLGTIDYWFVADGRRIHKTVHHFVLLAQGGDLSDDDIEVLRVGWFPLSEVAGRLSYPDERRIAGLAREALGLPA